MGMPPVVVGGQLCTHRAYRMLVCNCISVCCNNLNPVLNIELTRSFNMAELRKLRRQFISYTKMHPTENVGQVANMFVQYLNRSLC